MKKGLPCTPTARNARADIGEKPVLYATPAIIMEFVVMEPRGMEVVTVMKDLTEKFDALIV